MKRILLIITTLLAAALVVSVRYSAIQRNEHRRLLTNQEALLSRNHEYRVRDSLNAISVGILSMRADELRRGFDGLSGLVRDMDVKLKRVESLSQASIEGRYEVKAAVRDTVVIVAREMPASAQAVHFSDPHMELQGFILDSVFHGSILTRDTLTQVVHRIPRRFLFIKWGTKELRQEIVNSNPHSRITYSRIIRIDK